MNTRLPDHLKCEICKKKNHIPGGYYCKECSKAIAKHNKAQGLYVKQSRGGVSR